MMPERLSCSRCTKALTILCASPNPAIDGCFRRFERLASGATGGPGAAAVWSFRYLVAGLFREFTGSAGLPQPPCFGFDL